MSWRLWFRSVRVKNQTKDCLTKIQCVSDSTILLNITLAQARHSGWSVLLYCFKSKMSKFPLQSILVGKTIKYGYPSVIIPEEACAPKCRTSCCASARYALSLKHKVELGSQGFEWYHNYPLWMFYVKLCDESGKKTVMRLPWVLKWTRESSYKKQSKLSHYLTSRVIIPIRSWRYF